MQNAARFGCLFVATCAIAAMPAIAVEHKLSLPEVLEPIWFGYSVAVDGDEVWVGEPLYDDTAGEDTGRASRYRWNGATWSRTSFERTLSNRWPGDRFGHAVAVEGEIAAFTIPYADLGPETIHPTLDAGLIYAGGPAVYNQQLNIPVEAPYRDSNQAGISLALANNYLIAGAPGRAAEDGGTALVWVRSALSGTWSLPQELTPSPGTANAHFGEAVDIDGAWAVVGAPLDDGAEPGGGAAYLFERNSGTWTQRTMLLPPGAGASQFDYFGGAVALRSLGLSLWIAVGARGRGSTGSVFLYEVVLIPSFSVLPRGELSPAELGAGALFGRAVAMSGDRLVVGAPGALAQVGGTSARAAAQTGAIYAYERNGSSWIEVGSGTASDASAFDQFGFAVATDGARVVVGSPEHGPGSPNDPGAAYIYEWTDLATGLFADGFESGDLSHWSASVPAP